MNTNKNFEFDDKYVKIAETLQEFYETPPEQFKWKAKVCNKKLDDKILSIVRKYCPQLLVQCLAEGLDLVSRLGMIKM
jgi:hypothetical protein